MSDHYKEIANHYDKLGKKYHTAVKTEIIPGTEKFIKLLPKNSRVLEVSSSGGRDANKFLKAGFEVDVIDISKKFIENTKRTVPKAKSHIMDARKLTFPSMSFDGIFASAFLVHILRKDAPKVIKGFYRVLKLSGLLFITAKRGFGEKKRAEKLSQGIERKTIYYTKKELEKYLKDQGFKIIFSKLTKPRTKWNVTWIRILAQK